VIVNRSNFEYIDSGEKGAIESILPVQQVINTLLETIAESKTNVLGEVAFRYQFNKFYLQNSIAFGKFVNANIGIQYQL
jgi:predicted acetyltransferase